MARAAKQTATQLRALGAPDLERMAAIDQAQSGRSRRRFLEKRLATALEHPDDYLQLGLELDGQLAGYVLARILRGEFGHTEPVAAFDMIGVDQRLQERGYGHLLMDGLRTALQKRGITRLHSQSEWTSHAMLRFFDSTGFKLASRVVLEREVSRPLREEIAEF